MSGINFETFLFKKNFLSRNLKYLFLNFFGCFSSSLLSFELFFLMKVEFFDVISQRQKLDYLHGLVFIGVFVSFQFTLRCHFQCFMCSLFCG